MLNKTYKGIARLHLSYCCSVWGFCNESNISALRKIQNRAARIVTNSQYDASAAPLIQKLGWLTINILVKKETPTLICKSLSLLAPDYLTNLFIKCSGGGELFMLSSDIDVRIPLLKTINGQNAFSFRGAKLWNSLERETKSAPSLKIFKKQLLKGL